MNELIMGFITGILFGFLLHKAGVLRFEKQISALLFKDMTVFKVMLSAIMVGMVGLYLMKDLGVPITFKHKAMNLGAVIFGGVLFGIGWAIGGFCPGTSVGALAEGRLHALWVILGMFVGAGLFAEVYPFLKKTLLSWKDWGAISLPEAIRVNHWFVIVVLIITFLFVFQLFKKKNI